MRKLISILFGIGLAGCMGGGDSDPVGTSPPPAERKGPQIAQRESVDWTPLNSISAIKLANLHYFETGGSLGNKERLENIELKVFPEQKFVTFEIVPVGNASLHCNERGQLFQLMFVASPGADVSDRLTCTGQNFQRYQLSASYQTTTKFAANTLTIDGRARIQSDAVDKYGTEQTVYTVELHGAIQITGAGCRVISWRFSFPDTSTTRYASAPGNPVADRTNRLLEATAGTTCSLVRGGS